MSFSTENVDTWHKIALVVIRLHYFSQLPFSQVDEAIADLIVPANDAAIGHHFADAAIDHRHARTRWNWQLTVARAAHAAAAAAHISSSPPSVNIHVTVDSYASDDDEMPALVDFEDDSA
ncbi:hypothetical protein C8J56DRAFT_898642 [Mycena floridula]|nr:hypothetical protein C8J56DRAFT_898642 [Mycena floridula]